MSLDGTLHILTFLTVAITAYLGMRRFGLQRESATFLRVTVATREISRSATLALVSLSVKLDNLGQTRIDARTGPRDPQRMLYDDGWDCFQHAGTLKVRPIMAANEPLVFDWYSLPAISIAATLSADAATYGEVTRRTRDLEQVNYLDDYQDPEGNFAETHFWLEPKESYELVVMLWLRPGIYAAKASFLGRESSHEEEEYWSHLSMFRIEATPIVADSPGTSADAQDAPRP